MRKFLYVLFMSTVAVVAYAVPAKPGIVKTIQPDGSVIEILKCGDEFFNYTTTVDGYLLTCLEDGSYEYAEVTAEGVKSLGVKANMPAMRTADEMRLLSGMKVGDVAARLSELRSMRYAATKGTDAVRRRALGDNNPVPRGLVILVNFSDKSFVTTNPQESFKNMLSQEGYQDNGATGSARDYFLASSDGQYNPQFDVFGPYTLDKAMDRYGRNDRNGNEPYVAQMVVDAMIKLEQDDTVNMDFADYDTDDNDTIDFVFIFYAGYNEAEGGSANTIWPHSWEVDNYNTSGNKPFGGKKLFLYACTSELSGNEGEPLGMCGIGTFCHEFTHVLGLPDFYATNGSSHKTMGDWDLMDHGSYNNDGKTPPVFSAYERFFMDWMTPEVIAEDGSYKLEELKKSNKAYLLSENNRHNLVGDNPDPKEFYLMEYRDTTGWDKYIPNAGMLVTKVNFNERNWINNTANNNSNMMGVDLIEADGRRFGDAKAGDVFPGSAEVTSFTAFSGHRITDIALTSDTITFNVGILVKDCVVNADDVFLVANAVYGIEKDAELRCVDMLGRTLWTDRCVESPYKFDMPGGVYFIIVNQNGKQYLLKGLGR